MNNNQVNLIMKNNPPDDEIGYPEYQVEMLLEDVVVESATMNNFFEFMRGQTFAINEGEPIYYVRDVRRFLESCK